MLICDSQVHAPVTPEFGPVGSIDREPLMAEMSTAGVDRVVLVPRAHPSNPDNNAPTIRAAEERPDLFSVVALVDLQNRAKVERWAEGWSEAGVVRACRALGYRDPSRSLLDGRKLGWFWALAEELRIPTMLLAPDLLDRVAEIAEAHPDLPLTIDHMGIDPDRQDYTSDELVAAIERTNELARFPQVRVKASRVPGTVTESYPFRSTSGAVERLVDAWGPQRVFWGSDLTKLRCSYRECVEHFTMELDFLTSDDLEWVMGRGVCKWLGWEIPVDEV